MRALGDVLRHLLLLLTLGPNGQALTWHRAPPGQPDTPEKPGCYLWSPSGCPKIPRVRFDAWAHDTRGEAKFGAADSPEVCEVVRRQHFAAVCGTDDMQACFVPSGGSKLPCGMAGALASEQRRGENSSGVGRGALFAAAASNSSEKRLAPWGAAGPGVEAASDKMAAEKVAAVMEEAKADEAEMTAEKVAADAEEAKVAEAEVAAATEEATVAEAELAAEKVVKDEEAKASEAKLAAEKVAEAEEAKPSEAKVAAEKVADAAEAEAEEADVTTMPTKASEAIKASFQAKAAKMKAEEAERAMEAAKEASEGCRG